MFRHIGVSMIKPRTYFLHQRKFLFPSLIVHWECYQNQLLAKIQQPQDVTCSGDGRYDSMGHSAKYGTYTIFCNTLSKLIHFELVQVRSVKVHKKVCVVYKCMY